MVRASCYAKELKVCLKQKGNLYKVKEGVYMIEMCVLERTVS